MRLAHPGDRHPGPRRPRNGNRIWLVTSVVTVLVMVFVAVRLTGSGCPAASRAGGPPAGGGGSAAGASGSPSAGSSADPGRGAPGRHGGGWVQDGQPAGGQARAGQRSGASQARAGRIRDPGSCCVLRPRPRDGGSCGLGPFPAGGRYASLPRRSYASGRACGSYVDVSGPAGTVRAEVVDVCPDCAAATVDLSRAAFARIADPRTGTVAVSYQPAVDPPLPGPLELRITAAGPPGPLAVQVLNHGNRLSSVAASGPRAAGGSDWSRRAPTATGPGRWARGTPRAGRQAGSQPPWAAHQSARQGAGWRAAAGRRIRSPRPPTS